MNKVIFLDIDGVLNSLKTFVKHPFSMLGIDKQYVKIFNRIIEETEAKVVLSSTWRHNPNWKKIMKDNGLKCDFLGRTGDLNGIRGKEVKKWLEEHPETTKYAILDDDSDFYSSQPLFKTSFKTGLTEKIADKIIKYLNE